MSYYRKSILLSCLMHGILFLSLIISMPAPKSKQFVLKKSLSPQKQEIIKTTAIDGGEIEKEIQRLHLVKQEKIAQEKAQALVLKEQAQRAKEARLQEQRALKQLQLKQQQLRERQQAEIQKEKDKLASLKKAREEESKQLAASEQKRKALNDKIAKEKKEREQAIALEEKLKKDKEAQLALEKKRQQEKEEALALAKAREEKQQLVNAEVNRYKALLINAISQNWILPPNADKNLSCRFEIKLESSGKVINVTLLKSSGDPILDRSAETAIYSASPLPVPSMPEAFDEFKVVSLTVKPENL